MNRGLLVKLFMKGGRTTISGYFHLMEENSDDPWIILSDYKVYEDGEPITDTSSSNYKHLKAVRISDVESLSVVNEK